MGTYNKDKFTKVTTTHNVKKKLGGIRPIIEKDTRRTNLSFCEIIDHLIDNYRPVQVKEVYGKFEKPFGVKQSDFKGGQIKGKLSMGDIAKANVAKTQSRTITYTNKTKSVNLKQAGLLVR